MDIDIYSVWMATPMQHRHFDNWRFFFRFLFFLISNFFKKFWYSVEMEKILEEAVAPCLFIFDLIRWIGDFLVYRIRCWFGGSQSSSSDSPQSNRIGKNVERLFARRDSSSGFVSTVDRREANKMYRKFRPTIPFLRLVGEMDWCLYRTLIHLRFYINTIDSQCR